MIKESVVCLVGKVKVGAQYILKISPTNYIVPCSMAYQQYDIGEMAERNLVILQRAKRTNNRAMT